VVPGKKEHIPTWGQTTYALELDFEHAGDRYRVTRSKTTAKLVRIEAEGEVLVANGNTPVTAEVESMLGLSAKDYNLFVQSRQGETSGVLTFGATALNNKVEEFAGISLIDEVRTRASSVASQARARVEGLATEERLEEVHQECHAAADALQTATSELQHAEDQQRMLPEPVLSKPAVSAEALIRAQHQAQQSIASLRAAEELLGHRREALATAEQDLAGAPQPVDVAALEERKLADASQLATGRVELRSLNEAISHAVQADKQLSEARISLATVTHPTDEEAAEAFGAVDAAQLAKDTLISEQAALVNRLRDLKSLRDGAACPTCGTALSEHDPEKLAAEIEQTVQQQQALKQRLQDATEALGTANAHLQALSRRADEYDRLAAEVTKLEKVQKDPSELGDLRAQQNLLAQELDDLVSTLGRIEADLQNSREINTRHQTAVQRCTTASRLLRECEQQVADLVSAQRPAPTDAEIEAARAAEQAYQEERNQYQLNSSRLEGAVRLAKQVLANARQQHERLLEQFNAIADQVAEAGIQRARADQAGRLTRFLGDRRQSYLQDVWGAVLAAASHQVNSASHGAITRIVNDGGDFLYEEDGVLAPVSAASGAQKAFIGSALRIGLARALYGSDSLLIFDEPTESMSEHNASGLAASLAGAAHQLLLITHREQDQVLATNIITVGV
jgi:DNA repair exonuclease SbcCD ATPase subunit